MRTWAAVATTLVALVACGGRTPPGESDPDDVDAGCVVEVGAQDAGHLEPADAGAVPEVACNSDAGVSICLAAALHLVDCCGAGAASYGQDNPLGLCQNIRKLVLDPVERCQEIASADCARIHHASLCH